MGRPRKNPITIKPAAEESAAPKRKRKSLEERLQRFDLQKLTRLKHDAEIMIRAISAEGSRREQIYRDLKDTLVLDQSNLSTTAPAGLKPQYPNGGPQDTVMAAPNA